MNISYNWLKEYIDFNLSPEDLAAALTSTGLETGSIEEIESIRGGLRGLVIGKVLTCVDHPDSDHLHITTVDLGGDTPVQIVCGAPNVAAGQTVVVATVGTTLYDGDKEFQIKKSKIRGVESFGMICAEDEIGTGSSHDGIIVLADGAAAPGTPAAEYYGLTSDYVLEVDLTPNRIDAASHYGVARDLSAWLATHATASELRRPSVDAFAIDRPDGGIAVKVEATEACTRYAGVTMRGVKVAESPEWLRNRLNAIGLRPINNIVDITNYLLHSMGQPLHCFDLAKVDGGEIVVRTCADGTQFTTLDGVERKLDSRDLMICNAKEPMCIAGVFGGLDSGVTDTTTDIFIESACFNPTSVRKTARRHGLNTDASFRYERGTDPNICMYVLKLAALMVKELAGGEICGPVTDIYPDIVEPYPVSLTYSRVNSLIGKDIPEDTVDNILRLLEIDIKERRTDGELLLAVPTYRIDVRRDCDVIEEILRIYGYNNIELTDRLNACLSFRTFTDDDVALRRIISEQLTANGFNEILNNSLTAESYYTDNAQYPAENCVRLLNPLSNDLCVMRQTLLYGGLETIAHNVNRKLDNLALYELGNVYFRNPALQETAESPLAPYSENARLALWLTGALRPGNWARQAEEATFYDLRAAVTNILTRLGLSERELTWKAAQHPLLSASLDVATRSGKHLGTLGIVASEALKATGVKQPVMFAELMWRDLVELSLKREVTYKPLPKTLPVKRDLALLIDTGVTMARVEETVRRAGGKMLRTIELFDVYEGDKLPAGKKSYAITMTLQDDEKTLQDKQIEGVMNKIIASLKQQLGAELR